MRLEITHATHLPVRIQDLVVGLHAWAEVAGR
jgi:hypothetical protein